MIIIKINGTSYNLGHCPFNRYNAICKEYNIPIKEVLIEFNKMKRHYKTKESNKYDYTGNILYGAFHRVRKRYYRQKEWELVWNPMKGAYPVSTDIGKVKTALKTSAARRKPQRKLTKKRPLKKKPRLVISPYLRENNNSEVIKTNDLYNII